MSVASNVFSVFFFFFNDTATTEIYTLSLHDALPISRPSSNPRRLDQHMGTRARRTRRLLLIPAALALLAAGCGATGGGSGQASQSRPARVNLSLDWTPNPDHVGLYYAQQHGFFQRARLQVTMRAPSDPSAPIKLVGLNQVDLAISY